MNRLLDTRGNNFLGTSRFFSRFWSFSRDFLWDFFGKIFDDFCERLICDDEEPIYLYIAGEAGTGKSFLVKIMIEITKYLNMKSGDELAKPSALVMAPTANAAYLINGKTIESALGIPPSINFSMFCPQWLFSQSTAVKRTQIPL